MKQLQKFPRALKKNFFILLCLYAFEISSADYAGPQNGNGNAYGVPSDSFKPPPSGPYPPSGWKPAGRRLILPGESRSGYHPIDSGYGQPPPSQYGPSIDTPPNNQYIPGSFVSGPSGNGNGFNGNGHNGNGHNGNGHNGNGLNGNGHNGNGHNGNGHNGNGHNGNGHNGNGHNGNGHSGNGNGQGNGLNGNGIGLPTGNGHNGNGFSNGNGFPTGNGHNGNTFLTGNGHNGNGLPNGNGQNGNGNNGNGVTNGGNGHNGNGQNGNGIGNGGAHNGSNGKFPTFFTSNPGLVYPFIQVSVPGTVTAVRPGTGLGAGHVYPIFHVAPHGHNPHDSGTNILTSINPGTSFTYGSSFPTYATASAIPGLSNVFHTSQEGSLELGAAHPTFLTHSGGGIITNGIGHQALLSNGFFQKSNLLGGKTALHSLQLQHAGGHSSLGNLGIPVNIL